jgi:hypothetical protein
VEKSPPSLFCVSLVPYWAPGLLLASQRIIPAPAGFASLRRVAVRLLLPRRTCLLVHSLVWSNKSKSLQGWLARKVKGIGSSVFSELVGYTCEYSTMLDESHGQTKKPTNHAQQQRVERHCRSQGDPRNPSRRLLSPLARPTTIPLPGLST